MISLQFTIHPEIFTPENCFKKNIFKLLKLKTKFKLNSNRIKRAFVFKPMNFYKVVICLCCFLNSSFAFAQDKINWIDFEDLQSLQIQQPKLIFIYIYADWCVYCKKMERVSYKDKANIKLLNNDYYALKFNLEYEKQIIFNGNIYKNQELKTHRQPKHDLAKFLTGKQDKISLPAILILDQNMDITKQLHTYLSPEQLNLLLIQ